MEHITGISAIIVTDGVADIAPLVVALRAQTIPPTEILVVSPSGHDGIPAGVCHIENRGDNHIPAQYNVGAAHAKGNWLLLLQDDSMPDGDDMIEAMLLRIRPGCCAVASGVVCPGECLDGLDYWTAFFVGRWREPTVAGITGKFDLVRAETFQKIGGYDEECFFNAGEDTDLHIRLSDLAPVMIAGRVVHHRHIRPIGGPLGVLRKYFGYARGFGVNLRRHGWKLLDVPYCGRWRHHANKYAAPLLLLLPLWPPFFGALIAGLALLAQTHAWRGAGWRALAVPPMALAVCACSNAGALWGFVIGRAREKL